MQNCTVYANGDVPLTVVNMSYFQFPLRSRCAHVRLERKKILFDQSLVNLLF